MLITEKLTKNQIENNSFARSQVNTSAMATLSQANQLVTQLGEHLANWPNIKDYHFIGIERGGMLLARHFHDSLSIRGELGSLNIAFHRDDFANKGLENQAKNTTLTPSNIPFVVDGEQIMLIDDVFMTGRSTRAALNEIFDFGRPTLVRFACLIHLGVPQLPIKPDITAVTIQLKANQRVRLSQDKSGDFHLELRTKTNPVYT